MLTVDVDEVLVLGEEVVEVEAVVVVTGGP
jgi:hypothetical protein